MTAYERLGVFYLGRQYNLAESRPTDQVLLYDSRDLTTHAVCVGMTGSGKTGLGMALIEEAAIDGIPAIVIDPKGDMGNLLLNFPQLLPSDFLPWIDPALPARQGLTAEQYAASLADTWRQGLAAWEQTPARIQALRDAVEMAIYTPGSGAGLPLSVLRSFDAPPQTLRAEPDALRDRISGTVSSLLALLGIEADPMQSREHILLSSIIEHAWQAAENLALPDLIARVQTPPFDRIGVFDIETVFPSRDRLGLAMRLNNMLASPGFSAWTQGEPLDIRRLLYTPEGRPRLSILSIAHLGDAERLFFVTLVLNELITWMRTQPGTPSLRAMLYMDEIFGYFPPLSNPPTKTPMLTLLKQARAYGVGCVLATQNPVDLDYKGLANAGTWFIGRLQTERDKQRLMEGLEGASAEGGGGFDRTETDRILSGLGNRVFLMHNTHEDHPVVFQTRWLLSFLHGPLTRAQITTLMQNRRPVSGAASAAGSPPVPAAAPPSPAQASSPFPAGIQTVHWSARRQAEPGARILYRPQLLARAKLHYVDAPAKVDHWETVSVLAPLPEEGRPPAWEEASIVPESSAALAAKPEPEASYAELPGAAANAANYARWGAGLKEVLYQSRALSLWTSPDLRLTSFPGEAEGEFRVRVTQSMRERRDAQVEDVRRRHAAELATLQERLRLAQARVEREQSQYRQQQAQTLISLGATLLGALVGRKVASVGNIGRAASTMRSAGRIGREKEDIRLADESAERISARIRDLEQRIQEEVGALQGQIAPGDVHIAETRVAPRKSDIFCAMPVLAWTPWALSADGMAQPLLFP